MSIQIRRLTKFELSKLLYNAPETETRNLKRILAEQSIGPWEFFDNIGLEHSGIIIDGKPIYFAVLDKDKCLWTVINSNVKEQFTLFKISKRVLMQWLYKYGEIYATMQDINKKNIKWTKKLGFKIIEEKNNLITFILN